LQNSNNLFENQQSSQITAPAEFDENNIFSLFSEDNTVEEITEFDQYINEKPIPSTVNFYLFY